VPVPPNRSIVGDRMYHVESGIIASWVKNVGNEHLTEAFPFRPEFVGQRGPEIVLGKGSGIDSIHVWLDTLGFAPANDDEALELLEAVKMASLQKKGLLEAQEFKELVEAVRAKRITA
jgi:isopropylmalate/homocitrate/citramalate synthase